MDTPLLNYSKHNFAHFWYQELRQGRLHMTAMNADSFFAIWGLFVQSPS